MTQSLDGELFNCLGALDSHILNQQERPFWTVLETLFELGIVHSRHCGIDAVQVEAELAGQGSSWPSELKSLEEGRGSLPKVVLPLPGGP